MRHTFPKAEHLCAQRDIDALFQSGAQAATAYPLRIVARFHPERVQRPRVQVLLSVAKRRLRHAVDRNRAKRQIREAYRLQKELLWTQLPPTGQLHIALVWIADTPCPSALVHQRVAKLLQRIGEKLFLPPAQPIAQQDDSPSL